MTSLVRGRPVRVLAGALAAVALGVLPGATYTAPSGREPVGRPNIIVINTDDQRPETLRDMPLTRAWLQDGGTSFPRAYASTPSCCPSRASLMSGRYVHNNGQYGQLTRGFDLDLTTQRFLQDDGYFTGHAGKFLHWLPLDTPAPHWDRWTYFKGGYTDVAMNWDGRYVKSSGNSTVITIDRAIDYLEDFQSRDDATPFYLHLAPIAPHSPTTPEEKYADAEVSPVVELPSHDEADVTDKPASVLGRTVSPEAARANRVAQIRTLLTLDEQVDRLMRYLEAAGELENTLVVYTSDNGYLWGEHTLTSKFLPYREAVSVPFLVRWPGRVRAGAVDPRQVTHVDVLPTLLAAAGITQDLAELDGRDFLAGEGRDQAYLEYFYDSDNNNGIPTWASIRTSAYQYTEYYGTDHAMDAVTDREYYDLVADPYQLVNLLGDDATGNDPPNLARLSADLAAATTCAGATCP